MIRFGANGRVSGEYLVTEILSKKLVTVPGDGLQFTRGHYEVHDCSFSERVKRDPELAASFRTVVSDLLKLFRETEQDLLLRVSESRISDRARCLLGHGRLSGIRALLLFSEGLLKLQVTESGAYILSAEPDLLSGIPDGETYFRTLLQAILRFSGEREAHALYVIPFSGYMTKEAGSDLSVTYLLDEQLEKDLSKERAAEELLVDPDETEAAPASEEQVRVLQKLSELFQEVERNQYGQDSAFHLPDFSVSSGKIIKKNGYSVAIPDEFSYIEDRDGQELILWFPNPENPEEYEASGLLMKTSGIRDLPHTGEAVTTVSEGQVSRYRIRKEPEAGVLLFDVEILLTGTVKKEDAEKLVREFSKLITCE